MIILLLCTQDSIFVFCPFWKFFVWLQCEDDEGTSATLATRCRFSRWNGNAGQWSKADVCLRVLQFLFLISVNGIWIFVVR